MKNITSSPRPIDSAFFKYIIKNKFAVLAFLSSDWKSMKPWSVDGQPVGYFSRVTQEREIGTLYSFFIGPFYVCYYKVKNGDNT